MNQGHETASIHANEPVAPLMPARWRFDKRIGLDVIISFIALGGSLLAWARYQELHQAKTETRVEALEKADERIQSEAQRSKDEQMKQLTRIEDKLDRVIESRHR